jgi:hypothetical protein
MGFEILKITPTIVEKVLAIGICSLGTVIWNRKAQVDDPHLAT